MSSQNTIVERASAELTKRINGLRKHSSNSTSSTTGSVNNSSVVGKTSVMERVTNVFCGGGSSNNNNVHSNNINNNINNNTQNSMSISTPEKPYRYQSKHQHNSFFHSSKMSGGLVNNPQGSNQTTPQSLRKYHSKPQVTTKRFISSPILSIEQLFLDEKFLQQFFFYLSSYERREFYFLKRTMWVMYLLKFLLWVSSAGELAQVCTTWRDILYRNPSYFNGLTPVLQCRELRLTSNQDKVKLYNSIIRRGFHSIALV